MAEPLMFKTEMDFAYGVPRELAPGVRRLVANNPGPYTHKGTNTYLVGGRSLAVIDPGPLDATHCAAILQAAGDRPITHIVLTHTHRDHSDGLPALLAATGAKTAGYGAYTTHSLVAAYNAAGEGASRKPDWHPDIVLRDGDRLTGDDWALEAIHTPGHAPDHLSFAFVPASAPAIKVLFPGDHVMAWNTSVVAPPEGSMADYLTSLEKLTSRDDTVAFPGHGGQYETPARVARAYLVHRRMRDAAILDAIREGATRVDRIVAQIYKGLDPRLVQAASYSVLAHVEHQVVRGGVTASIPLSLTSDLAISPNI